ncbi:SLC5/6 family protein [Psychroserpens mesophilus]|uniref:hypothetical protein n=1 Tax=Psychroserpens mesophilus TaxID=325473 RepID=UPI00058F8EA8|nr:hypothetical protein [Psychroserpens mesophilus]
MLTASILISLVFLVIGFYYKRSIKDLSQFFYYKETNNKRKLIFSLTAANLTLGTGLVYLAAGGFSNGLIFFLIPLCIFIGYLLLNKFLKYVKFSSNSNYFDFIDNEIGDKSKFKFLITLILIVTFLFVLSYEIFASSSILTPLLFDTNDILYQILVAIVLILVSLIYATSSGMKGVIKSDILQLCLILLALLFLIFGNQKIDFTDLDIYSKFKFNGPIILTTILAGINAISTQFYSILNHGVITNAEPQDRASILKKVGIFSGLILSLFILFGLILPNDANISDFTVLLKESYSKSSLVFIGIGFLSIIYSTLDSLLVIISMFTYKNILNKDIINTNKKDLNNVKAIISFCFILILFPLGWFFFNKPSLFYLLLGIGSGITVVVPLIILSGFLLKNSKIKALRNAYIYPFFIFFITAHLVYIYLMKNEELAKYLSYISYIFFAISSIYALIIAFLINKKWKKQKL